MCLLPVSQNVLVLVRLLVRGSLTSCGWCAREPGENQVVAGQCCLTVSTSGSKDLLKESGNIREEQLISCIKAFFPSPSCCPGIPAPCPPHPARRLRSSCLPLGLLPGCRGMLRQDSLAVRIQAPRNTPSDLPLPRYTARAVHFSLWVNQQKDVFRQLLPGVQQLYCSLEFGLFVVL